VDSPVAGAVPAKPGRIGQPKHRWWFDGGTRMRDGMECDVMRDVRHVNHVVRLMNHNLHSGSVGKPTILVTSLKACLSKINLISLFIGKNSLFIDFA